MYFRLMGKLNARRNGQLAESEKGFTLIELLVVVIIIGILAAIAIPVYLGVQKNAKDSAVKTDVTNLKTALVSVQTTTDELPATGESFTTTLTPDPTFSAAFTGTAPTWKSAGATLSQYTKTLSFATSGDNFCIHGVSKTTNDFWATDSTGVSSDQPADATCTGL